MRNVRKWVTLVDPSHGQPSQDVAAAQDGSHVLDYREKVQSVRSLWICGVYPFEVAQDFAIAPPNVQHMHALLLLQDIFVINLNVCITTDLPTTFSLQKRKLHPYNCFISIISQQMTIKLATDSAPVATQIVHDIENYSTNFVGSYNMIMAHKFFILMVCYKTPNIMVQM